MMLHAKQMFLVEMGHMVLDVKRKQALSRGVAFSRRRNRRGHKTQRKKSAFLREKQAKQEMEECHTHFTEGVHTWGANHCDRVMQFALPQSHSKAYGSLHFSCGLMSAP